MTQTSRRHRWLPLLAGLVLFGLLGLALYALPRWGVAPSSVLAAYGLQIGALLGLLLLACGLAHHQTLAREAHLHAQGQQAHITELEDRLQARTRELNRVMNELTSAQTRLQELSQRDALTGLNNRLFLAERLPEIWRHSVRWKHPLAVLMIDIDHFKQVNDSHGHELGDEALKAVGQLISRLMQRPGDLAVRYGGEVFLVVLPQTHTAGAAHMAERIRQAVQDLAFAHEGQSMALTVSIGVACATPGPKTPMQAMLHLAEQLRDQAKAAGRNCCMLQPSALAQINPSSLVSSAQS